MAELSPDADESMGNRASRLWSRSVCAVGVLSIIPVSRPVTLIISDVPTMRINTREAGTALRACTSWARGWNPVSVMTTW